MKRQHTEEELEEEDAAIDLETIAAIKRAIDQRKRLRRTAGKSEDEEDDEQQDDGAEDGEDEEFELPGEKDAKPSAPKTTPTLHRKKYYCMANIQKERQALESLGVRTLVFYDDTKMTQRRVPTGGMHLLPKPGLTSRTTQISAFRFGCMRKDVQKAIIAAFTLLDKEYPDQGAV